MISEVRDINQTKLVVFDLDGTLFRTETVDIIAINKALEINGYKAMAQKDILGFIGMTLEAICKEKLGMHDKDNMAKFSSDLARFEREEIALNGKLYDGVKECLERLKRKGFTLCICSNGGRDYVMGIVEKFKLGVFFADIRFSDGIYTKSEAVGLLKKKYNAAKFIMVGDRSSDIQAAKDNMGISIGVSYGFGNDEILAAHYVAHSVSEVEELIYEVFNNEKII